MAKWKKDKMANNNLQNSEQYELHTKPMLTQMLWKGEQWKTNFRIYFSNKFA
jgi:hypothetical protein